ncbi:MAG: aminodeoxychorismate synthase component I [Myxococcota bacterium]|nr:aminodeoxychorismate synthase component I [Myxococcota bacterium]
MSRPDQVGASEAVALDWREIAPIEGGILRAFEEFRENSFPWLLDSALQEHGLGRFSFAGSDPYLVIRVEGEVIEEHCRRAVRVGAQVGHSVVEGNPLARFRALLRKSEGLGDDLPLPLPFVGGAVGYLGYEFMADSKEDRRSSYGDEIDFADATLLLVDRVLVVDHETARMYVLGLGFGADSDEASRNARSRLEELLEQLAPLQSEPIDADPADSFKGVSDVEVLRARPPKGLRSDFEESGYTDHVLRIKDEIAAGNVYEANLTHRMITPFVGDPWQLYQSLRRISPAPFACFLEVPDGVVVGSSPERFLRLSAEGEVESRPIKGTRRRGANESEDRDLERELVSSEKDRAENLMIVDLVRNDLGRVCRTGSIEVPRLMQVERYASVFQMVSVVTGRLREDCDGLDLVRAAFPPGSMTGAPKIAAISLLEDLEPVRRGVYSGAVGYFDQRGGMDLSVVIRTILLRKERACLHVGGAVVADSDAASEYAETIDKARALWAALCEVSEPDQEGGVR